MKREHGPGTADSEPAKKAKVTPAKLTKADLQVLACGTRIAWNSKTQSYASGDEGEVVGVYVGPSQTSNNWWVYRNQQCLEVGSLNSEFQIQRFKFRVSNSEFRIQRLKFRGTSSELQLRR